jgi:hypothetical protein
LLKSSGSPLGSSLGPPMSRSRSLAIGTDAAHRREQHADRQVDQRGIRVVAQVRDVLHCGNDPAADAGQLVLEALHHGRLCACDSGEQFGEMLCGNLQHGGPRRWTVA